MKPFSPSEIARVRHLRKHRWPMRDIVARISATGHTRNDIVEACDATIRFQDNEEATAWVNRVLAHQANGVPLINGHPVHPFQKEPGR